MIRGMELCKPGFMAVTHSKEGIIRGVLTRLKENKILYSSRRGEHRVGVEADRTKQALDFLRVYAEEHGHPCPTGRGSKPDQPIIRLPIHHQKRKVYEAYKRAVDTLDTKPLSRNYFASVWVHRCKYIKVATQ